MHKFEFQTLAPVCEFMVSLIPPGSRTILEPTPGMRNISRLLKGYKLTEPKDFFLLDQRRRFDCIIMNPPFSLKYGIMTNAPARYQDPKITLGYEILRDCMTMSDSIIALMPFYTIIDSDVRTRELNKFGIKSIIALPRKTFAYTRVQTCILELRKGWKKKATFEIFNF